MTRRLLTLGWRQFALLAAMITLSSLVARNLVYWQVTEHVAIAQQASLIYDAKAVVPAPRGGIFDTNGLQLVGDAEAFKVAVDPVDTPKADKAYNAAQLGHILRQDPSQIRSLLDLPHSQYVVIADAVDATTAARIRALGLAGVILVPTYRAVYPQGSLAAAVLGFVNDSGVGQYGVEQYYNQALTGHDGSQFMFVDTANRPLPVGVRKPQPEIPGASIELTIDSRIQAVVERRLALAIQHFHAENGSAIVMDPHTGAILAMASLPSYDPNNYNTVTDPSLYENLALANYQPGSTFKIIGISAGFDSKAFTTTTTIDDPGYYQNYGITVRNWEVGTGWGIEDPEKMLRYSANVGMAQFANMEGPLTFYKYVVNRYGFGSPTGIDLPDESWGFVRTPTNGQEWQMMDLLTNSYGQGINVTPLQLVTAVAALANGGWRMRPYIVKSIQYPAADHHPDYVARPHRVIQAVSPGTAQTMTEVLRHSAEDGEATCALTKNYPVAAKTGTATIEGPSAHGMDYTGGTVASLIGYGPVNDPKFVMLVQVRRPNPGPTGNDIWGSVVAAPAWHDIALSLYRIMGILPQPGSTPATLDYMQGPQDWNCTFTPQ